MTAECTAQLVEDDVVPRRPRGALALWRRTRAVELAAAGRTYQEIADELGYSSRGNAWRIVQKVLGERMVDDVEYYRLVELDRLNALQAAIWPKAVAGDVRAVSQIRRIIQVRVRLLGLDKRTAGAEETPSGPRTLVVSPEEWAQYAGDDVGPLG